MVVQPFYLTKLRQGDIITLILRYFCYFFGISCVSRSDKLAIMTGGRLRILFGRVLMRDGTKVPKGKMKADLHCHTALSDGTLGIEDLLVLARNGGLDKISITDHECITSAVRGATIAKRMDGFEVIIGCEFSATDVERDSKVHILCYLPDSPERLEQLCIFNTNTRIKAGKIMVKRASEKFNIPMKYIASCAQGSNYISKQHIMKALMNCGYTTSIFGELFDSLFTKGSPDYIGVRPRFPEPKRIIKEIHEAGGIAVLAHPGFYDNFDLFDELVEQELIDGVEVWHPKNTPEQQERLIKTSKDHGLLMTGGSDFHGAFNSEAISIGAYTTPEEQVNELLSFKNKRNKRKRAKHN